MVSGDRSMIHKSTLGLNFVCNLAISEESYNLLNVVLSCQNTFFSFYCWNILLLFVNLFTLWSHIKRHHEIILGTCACASISLLFAKTNMWEKCKFCIVDRCKFFDKYKWRIVTCRSRLHRRRRARRWRARPASCLGRSWGKIYDMHSFEVLNTIKT